MHVRESKTLGLNTTYAGSLYYTSHKQHSPFLQKRAVPAIPLKDCTSSNAGEMWKAGGGAQVDSIWVCQNNKWIPYE